MDTQSFNEVIDYQIARSRDVLVQKAEEYATTDRLHHFKVSARLLDSTPMQALGGMMCKHTISLYDMINSGEDFSEALWDEKITDHINYLLLLKACVVEDKNERAIADTNRLYAEANKPKMPEGYENWGTVNRDSTP